MRIVGAVRVDRGNDLSLRRVDARQNRCRNSFVGFVPKNSDVRVITKQRLQHLKGVVFAAIIDEENLQVPLS